MESPLNAREFLKRFHLPQLVRLSGWGDANHESSCVQVSAPEQQVAAVLNPRGAQKPSKLNRSNTSISSSFVAINDSHNAKNVDTNCEFTYKSHLSAAKSHVELANSKHFGLKLNGGLSDQEEAPNNNFGFRSLVTSTVLADDDSPGYNQPKSINAWSSNEVNRFLLHSNRLNVDTNLKVRVPRASLIGHGNRMNTIMPAASSGSDLTRRDRLLSSRNLNANHPKREDNVGASISDSLNSIRLTPPSQRITFNKLQLNQPFLLYKAFKKLELSAYLIDAKNELYEKSGDPIYFPQDYLGWLSLNSLNQNEHLESIDQVCQLDGQIFLTRDEIKAYQLPSKLSHLTKLKNNQLLALPLAINLEKIHSADTSGGQQSDIKQVIIKCGQVLKICGIYEDVMPLIESSGLNNANKQDNSSNHMAAYDYQQLAQQVAFYQQQQQQPILMPNGSNNSKQRKLLYANNGRLGQQAQQQLIYMSATTNMQLQPQQQYLAVPPLIYSARQHQQLTDGQPLQPKQKPTGQRYARCILLNQRSVDMITGPLKDEDQLKDALESEEIEVLIPINQKGRFYLCATNQSILNELYCYKCNLQQRQKHLVYKMSQLITMINLSRKLNLKNDNCNLIKLPLNVQLVIGSRPKNFSPTMFGLSSAMENYFKDQNNVGGHVLSCKFNRNNILTTNNQATVCNCSQLASPLGNCQQNTALFSANLRIEQVCKRDVLLACTIKKEPLIKLNLSSTPSSPVSNLFRDDIFCSSDSSNPQLDKLFALRETPPSRLQGGRKLLDKSSFSRLRVCRSLISLNGGKKKCRPNIPSSMMIDTSQQNYHQNVDANLQRLSSLNINGGSSYSCAQRASQSNSLNHNSSASSSSESSSAAATAAASTEDHVVLIEFDCNENNLKFARTFVENSIPTSTIPDLVLNRMEFCQRNSLDWERQLKLSYGTLSQDFDACQQQISEQRAKAASSIRLERASMFCEPNDGGANKFPAAVATAAAASEIIKESGSQSTTSSRSSSGVSSAGGLRRDKSTTTMSKSSAGGLDGAGSKSSSISSSLEKQPSGQQRPALRSQSQPQNPLLRFMSRILPTSQPAGKLAMNNNETIMNAQKIHRKLNGCVSGGSAGSTSSASDNNFDNEAEAEAFDGLRNRAPSSPSSACSASSSGSHLYESLERLNEKLSRKKQVKSLRRLKQQQHQPVMSTGDLGRNFPKSRQQPAPFDDEDEWWRLDGADYRSQRPAKRGERAGGGQIKYAGNAWSPRRLSPEAPVANFPTARSGTTGQPSAATASGGGGGGSTTAMEPVSIEACPDDFIASVEESEQFGSDQGAWAAAAAAEPRRPSLQQQAKPNRIMDSGENVYINLINRSDTSASDTDQFAGQQQAERTQLELGQQPRGRMERKLMRVRGRHIVSAAGSMKNGPIQADWHVAGWPGNMSQ